MNLVVPQMIRGGLFAGMEKPQEAVDAGREALDPWWSSYPWYDAENEEVEAIDLSQSWWESQDWSGWDWSGWDWSGWEWPDWLWPDFLGDWSFSVPSSPREWFIWITGTTLAILLLFVLIRMYRRHAARKSELAAAKQAATDEDDTARIESLPFSVAKGKLNLLDEAQKHYGLGDYAKAVVYLFSFQLVELDKHQHIHLTKGKTNRQYMREVGPRRPLRAMVEQTMVAFEDVFFGNLSLDRGRFESCWSQLDEFQTRVAEKDA